MIVTGDTTQSDLPQHRRSGLTHAWHILQTLPDIGFHRFATGDIVRHPLVQRVVEAYERDGKRA